MDAARIVLDRIKLDAEYPHGDIGWEFWKSEANRFRTNDQTTERVDCALFARLTSLPKEDSRKRTGP